MYIEFRKGVTMNNDDLMIASLPIKPQKKTNIGMLLAPTIVDYVGSVLNAHKNLGVNILHSYDDKNSELNEYMDYINNSKIKYDSLFIDENYTDKMLEIADDMYSKGQLLVKNKQILRCDCGRVDMVYSLGNNAKLYHIKDGKIFCNYCNKECHIYDEKVLTFPIDSDLLDISITPTFLKKEIYLFQSSFKNSEIMISKYRNTGYNLNTKEGIFNIDIDFIWMNYFKLFDKTNQIYVASNHQLFLMYLMNYIAKKTSDIKLTFIANPYINANLEIAKKQYETRKLEEYKKLLLLYNLKWKNKNCNWSDSNYEYLNNISNPKIINLYKSMIISAREMYNEDIPFDEMLYQILKDGTNMQSNIKTMKRLNKEKRL